MVGHVFTRNFKPADIYNIYIYINIEIDVKIILINAMQIFYLPIVFFPVNKSYFLPVFRVVILCVGDIVRCNLISQIVGVVLLLAILLRGVV